VKEMNKDSLDWSKWLPIFLSGGAVAISIIALLWNILSEQARYRAQLEVWGRRTINEIVVIGARAVIRPSNDDRIGKPQEQVGAAGADTPRREASGGRIINERVELRTGTAIGKPPERTSPRNDVGTMITLIFRNLSYRPTAVIDIYVREKEGILGGRGYNGQIKLPIQIEPWGVKEVDFQIEKNDEKRMTDILIIDEDDKTAVIPNPGQTWTKTISKK
jgi:hypothetical protein